MAEHGKHAVRPVPSRRDAEHIVGRQRCTPWNPPASPPAAASVRPVGVGDAVRRARSALARFRRYVPMRREDQSSAITVRHSWPLPFYARSPVFVVELIHPEEGQLSGHIESAGFEFVRLSRRFSMPASGATQLFASIPPLGTTGNQQSLCTGPYASATASSLSLAAAETGNFGHVPRLHVDAVRRHRRPRDARRRRTARTPPPGPTALVVMARPSSAPAVSVLQDAELHAFRWTQTTA